MVRPAAPLCSNSGVSESAPLPPFPGAAAGLFFERENPMLVQEATYDQILRELQQRYPDQLAELRILTPAERLVLSRGSVSPKQFLEAKKDLSR